MSRAGNECAFAPYLGSFLRAIVRESKVVFAVRLLSRYSFPADQLIFLLQRDALSTRGLLVAQCLRKGDFDGPFCRRPWLSYNRLARC